MNSNKILFIQTAFPGDAILILPAIQKLKETEPESSIDVLCIPETKDIFAASPSVSTAIVIDKRGKHSSLASTYKFIKDVKKNNYDKIYSSHRSFRTAIIVFLLDVKECTGFDNASLMHIYKHLIPYNINRHEVQRNLDLVGYSYDEDTWKIIPELKSGVSVNDKIKLFLDLNKITDSFIAIAPGSVWNTKKYPFEYFKEIIKALIDKKYKVVLIGGKNDENICVELAFGFREKVIVAAGKFSIVESVELLRASKLLITNDSAPTHMGIGANIKVLTIYCSTVPKFGFYPYNNKSSYISYNDLECKPCGIHGHDVCPINTFDCGMKLLPENIILKAEEMLSD